MTGNIRSNRPARAAIAAVLAFSATPLLAQTAAPPPVASTVQTPPPPAAEPMAVPVAAPAPAPMAATTATVQPTASVEERLDAAIAQSEAEQAQTVPAARTVRRVAPVERPVEQAPRRQVAAPVEVAPVAAVPTARQSTAPAVAPAETVIVDPVASAPAQERMTTGNDALTWGLAGGALLIAGIAGIAGALAFRRRRGDAVEEGVTLHTSEGIVTVPEAAVVPEREAPVFAAPVFAAPIFAATVPVATAPAMRPVLAPGRQHDSLEAMVAAPPSAANPFLTRRNRLRRAEFLLAQGDVRAAGAKIPAGQQAVAAPQPVDRSQTIYRFGPEKGRPAGLFPRTR